MSAPNTYERPSVASRQVTSHLIRTSACRKSYSMESLRLEDVHELEDASGIRPLQPAARIREERLGRPIRADGAAQCDVRQVEAGVLDVAEDPLARAREVPHRANGDGSQDLGRAGEEAVRVFQLIVSGGEPEAAREAQERRHRTTAPRRVPGGILLPAEVELGADDHAPAVNGEVARQQGTLMSISGVALGAIHSRDLQGPPRNGDPLGAGERRLPPIVVRRD